MAYSLLEAFYCPLKTNLFSIFQYSLCASYCVDYWQATYKEIPVWLPVAFFCCIVDVLISFQA